MKLTNIHFGNAFLLQQKPSRPESSLPSDGQPQKASQLTPISHEAALTLNHALQDENIMLLDTFDPDTQKKSTYLITDSKEDATLSKVRQFENNLKAQTKYKFSPETIKSILGLYLPTFISKKDEQPLTIEYQNKDNHNRTIQNLSEIKTKIGLPDTETEGLPPETDKSWNWLGLQRCPSPQPIRVKKSYNVNNPTSLLWNPS